MTSLLPRLWSRGIGILLPRSHRSEEDGGGAMNDSLAIRFFPRHIARDLRCTRPATTAWRFCGIFRGSSRLSMHAAL